jgi:hypothetical protein
MHDDPRHAAQQYRLDRDARAAGEQGTDAAAQPAAERGSTAAERAAYVETSIQQAIRRGDFDNLPGAGKPLEGLGETHDPDWWIRRKIASEQLTGLGPPALSLRVEHARMHPQLDALAREEDVREAVADFNRRVIEARRQLLGGPPVVTPTLDVEAEVAGWAERRSARTAREDAASARRASDAPRAQRWWRRARSR